MIDGIINNGDRRKDQEEKKPSVMEKLQEKKKEAAEVEATRPVPSRVMRKFVCKLWLNEVSQQ